MKFGRAAAIRWIFLVLNGDPSQYDQPSEEFSVADWTGRIGSLKLELVTGVAGKKGPGRFANRLSRSQACLQLETLAADFLAGTFHLPIPIGGSETHGALERYECRTRLSTRTSFGTGRRHARRATPPRAGEDQRGIPDSGGHPAARQRGAASRYERIRHQLRSDDRGQDHRLRPYPDRRPVQG